VSGYWSWFLAWRVMDGAPRQILIGVLWIPQCSGLGRGRAVLPEVAAPALPKVHMTRISPVRFADAAAETALALRYHYQMNMIGHQTIRPYRNIRASAPFRHQLKVEYIVLIAEKRLHTTVATRCYMMRQPWCYLLVLSSPYTAYHSIKTPNAIIKYGIPRTDRTAVWCPQNSTKLRITVAKQT